MPDSADYQPIRVRLGVEIQPEHVHNGCWSAEVEGVADAAYAFTPVIASGIWLVYDEYACEAECEPDRTYAEWELRDGSCPNCGGPVEWQAETSTRMEAPRFAVENHDRA